jgi:ABC-2 type transport system permease protein
VNLFLRELKAYRKSTIIWVASLSGIVVLYMAMYPAFSQDVQALEKVLQNFPEAIRTALNLSAETFLTVSGFYGYLLSFAILAAAIQAMNLGTGVVSKEIAGKTADFLVSKPVTRTRVITAKLAAVFVLVAATNLVFIAISFAALGVAAPGEFDAGTVLLLAGSMFLVQLFFLALGMLLGVVLPKVKSVVSVSLPTVFAFYIIGMLGDVLGNVEARYVSPFRYYDPAYIIRNASLESKYLFVEAAVVIVGLVLSYVIFLKKDIPSAT